MSTAGAGAGAGSGGGAPAASGTGYTLKYDGPPGGVGTCTDVLPALQDTISYPTDYKGQTEAAQRKAEAAVERAKDKDKFLATSAELMKQAEEIEKLHRTAEDQRTEAMLRSHPGEWDVSRCSGRERAGWRARVRWLWQC